jgi:hypothetical protein
MASVKPPAQSPVTYCQFYDGCFWGAECPCSLTETAKKEAQKNNWPVVRFLRAPACFMEQEDV